MESIEKKRTIVSFLLEQGILADEALIERLEREGDYETWFHDNVDVSTDGTAHVRLKTSKLPAEPILQQSIPQAPNVRILKSFDRTARSWNVQDFVNHYCTRLGIVESMLRVRQELQGLTAIARVLQKRERSTVSIIGLVSDISTTKNGNLSLTIEDPTGQIKVMVSQSKPELFAIAKSLVLDEVIGVVGASADKLIFASTIIQPDVPLNKELKKSQDEAYAAFLSDIHVGSNKFLGKELQKFLGWLSGESGSESQREIASKIKYLFIIGDIVDGVGVYPSQETELTIPDIYDQYKEAARYISQIPQHITVIICPGNHDAVHLSEPQPAISTNYAGPLYALPNVLMVSNPALINIHASEGFSGFDILLYHGYSFDYYVANVDAIRNQGGYDRADIIMKYLLKKRHLAPSHKSTLYTPDPQVDNLIIQSIPDILATGHIHKCSVSHYRNITLICGSCWQSKTTFQEKVGHHPEPCRVPVVNLKTRAIKILKFGEDDD